MQELSEVKQKFRYLADVEYWQVTWELDGGEWTEDDNNATQVAKDGALAEPNAPVKTGSEFDGWYKEPALTNRVTFPYDVSGATADITLYAKREIDEPGHVEAMVASGGLHYFVLNDNGTVQLTALSFSSSLVPVTFAANFCEPPLATLAVAGDTVTPVTVGISSAFFTVMSKSVVKGVVFVAPPATAAVTVTVPAAAAFSTFPPVMVAPVVPALFTVHTIV